MTELRQAESAYSGYNFVDSYSSLQSIADQGACLKYNPCDPLASCTATPNSAGMGKPVCECPEGYSGNGFIDYGGCRDIDECLLSETNSCEPYNEKCINLPGSYACQCEEGYELNQNGTACVDIDECDRGRTTFCNGFGYECSNFRGGWQCICDGPSEIFDLETFECRAVNPCTYNSGDFPNPCDPDYGICSFDGVDTMCTCPEGMTVGSDNECIDINECEQQWDICDPTTSICRNTIGSYVCECADGFTTSADGLSCVNYNECNIVGICGKDDCCLDLDPSLHSGLKYHCAPSLRQIQAIPGLFEGTLVYEVTGNNITPQYISTVDNTRALSIESNIRPDMSPNNNFMAVQPQSIQEIPSRAGIFTIGAGFMKGMRDGLTGQANHTNGRYLQAYMDPQPIPQNLVDLQLSANINDGRAYAPTTSDAGVSGGASFVGALGSNLSNEFMQSFMRLAESGSFNPLTTIRYGYSVRQCPASYSSVQLQTLKTAANLATKLTNTVIDSFATIDTTALEDGIDYNVNQVFNEASQKAHAIKSVPISVASGATQGIQNSKVSFSSMAGLINGFSGLFGSIVG